MSDNSRYVKERDVEEKANLGLATTHELIAELMARADVAKAVGETWPLYSTFYGEPVGEPVTEVGP